MSYESLELERAGPVLRVWLNRPDKLNAIDETMLRELGDLYLSLDTEFETRVVVLGGRGRSFCAGFDRRKPPASLSADISDRERRWAGQLGRRACRAIEECEALTVARLHGHVLGGGACFALACDFRIGAAGMAFRYPEVDIGVPLSWAGVPRLLSELGAARARELLILCRELDAQTAESWGVLNRRVEPEVLDGEVQAWVDALLAKPELAVHQTKTQLRGYARLFALGDASETDGDMISVARGSSEMRRRFGLKKD